MAWHAFSGDRDQCRLRRRWTKPDIFRDDSHAYSDTNANSKPYTQPKPHAHSDADTCSHANAIACTGALEHYCGSNAESLV